MSHITDFSALSFVKFALDCGVLKFGEFQLKSGRISPYFFNAGLFDDGEKMRVLAQFYAANILQSGIEFDMIFGPAYKGIPLAATVAVELAKQGKNVPLAYNRKEVKDHGEGGVMVGYPLRGRVLIIDDVISAGTAAKESIAHIKAAGATPCAMAIALDRQERAIEGGQEVNYSAIQFVKNQLGLAVCSVATLGDLLSYLQHPCTLADESQQQHIELYRERVKQYRERYGV